MKPILFSTPMVQAILNGTKLQTRRIIKPQPTDDGHGLVWGYPGIKQDNGYLMFKGHKTPCSWTPYGKVGDILWVRETWKYLGQSEDGENLIMFKDGSRGEIDYNGDREDYWIEKCEKLVETMEKKGKLTFDDDNERYTWKSEDVPWTPSIFIPKDACRIFLKITNIRVERLQDILVKDAINEGIENLCESIWSYKDYLNHPQSKPDFEDQHKSAECLQPISSFKSLWESINGKDSWNENPWVWVVEFEQTEKPE